MEGDGVCMPPTPAKPIPARSGLLPVQTMASVEGTGTKSLNEASPCIDDISYVQKEAVKVPPSECDGKKAHDVHDPQVGIGSVPSPSETKDSRKRRNNGNDFNKKPSKRSRTKRHRPKIFDDSKPKKVPKAQTPRTSTPRSKTPKPVTPDRVQETRKYSRKNKFTGSNVQATSTASIIAVKSCKRSLDRDFQLADEDSQNVSKSHEKPSNVNFHIGASDCFSKIVTSKRNTPRRSRFHKKNLKASEHLLGDNTKKECGEDISIIRNEEKAEKNVRRFYYVYQRRKKSNLNVYQRRKKSNLNVYQRRKKSNSNATSYIPTLQVYHRTFRKDQCLQNSKKFGPIFPMVFKKRRAKRKKATTFENFQYVVKRSHIKIKITTIKWVHNRVNKSKDNQGVVEPNLHIDKRILRVLPPKKEQKSAATSDLESLKCVLSLTPLAPLKKKRSNWPTRRRENIMDFPIVKAMPYDNEKRLLQQEESFLQITDRFPPQEVPAFRVESFTSQHLDAQLVDTLQDVPVLESQNLSPWHEDIPLTKEELNKLYVREMTMYLIRKMENLDINGPCKEIVVRDHKISEALVKVDPPKKRKVLPKVDLDEETLRVWKLLMENDGSETVEETDKDKEEWWERQRKIFHGRVDSFIAKMHLIQGNRRFSRWKGSVVDSVVGVYLTQNVSDHLSSSAFMSLAAKFPVKSRNKEVDYHGDVSTGQESAGSNTNVDEGFSNKNKMEQDMSNPCANVSEKTPTTEPKQEAVSNSILVQDNPRVNENSNTFRKLLELEEENYLKQFHSSSKDESSLNVSRVNEGLSANKGEGKEQNAVSFDSVLDGHLKNSESEFIVQQKETPEVEIIIVNPVCTLRSEITIEEKVDAGFSNKNKMEQDMINPCADVIDKTPTTEPKQEAVSNAILVQDNPCINENSNTFRKLLEMEEENYLKLFHSFGNDESPLNERRVDEDLSTNKGEGKEQNAVSFDSVLNGHLKNSESEFIVQQKATPEVEPIIVNPVCTLQSEITVEEKVDAANDHPNMKAKPLDTESTGKKKNRIEEKQEVKIDWEKMRKTYCKCGGKEINDDNMDAVDWDAVRRATVEEIAEIIVERGMNNVLAARIKEFLERMVKDHGSIDLEWLRDVPPDKAKEFLLSIQGIGLKSVECVRLLTLHHLAFPVDTNVGRVATRLGWVPLQPLPDEVQIHLLNAYPMVDNIQKYLFPRLCTLDQRTLYELHYQLITFGKVFCTKINPNCNACPMRAECRHYASAFASARLALPGSKESNVTSIVPAANEQDHSMHGTAPASSDLDLNNAGSTYYAQNCEPIIEVPPSPEPEVKETLPICDIEDYFCESDDEIPTIKLNTEEFREVLKDTIDANNISIPEPDMSKALVALTTEAASIRVPRMKFVAKLRTVHTVYELPDFHPSLAGFDEREHDDPSPYLLALWLPSETSKSLEYTENGACNSSNHNQEETVKGTVLIPCRTATRGKFPLNGTYFQINEVFADDETSKTPMDVPRCLLWNLPRRNLGCGTSATSIFKALSTSDIQRCFWKGSICVRGFNRETRQPRPLHRRFHISTTAVAAENKKLGKK